jgi:hypothetical protein
MLFVNEGQAFPPYCGCVVTVRVCVCLPVVPHPTASHALNGLQSDTTQSNGEHAGALQGAVFVNGGHALPPFAAAVLTVLVCVCVPEVPHAVALHALIGLQSETTQSTGVGAGGQLL